MAMKKLIYILAFLPLISCGAQFGDIPANLTLTAGQAPRRNSGNTLFEGFVAVGTTDTQTLTNKRLIPRVTTITSSATPAINTDNADAVTITALAVAITSMTSSLTGTPTNFQHLLIRFKDDGTGHAISWGASFASSQATLPTTTIANKVMRVGLEWDSVKSKWICLATDQEP